VAKVIDNGRIEPPPRHGGGWGPPSDIICFGVSKSYPNRTSIRSAVYAQWTHCCHDPQVRKKSRTFPGLTSLFSTAVDVSQDCKTLENCWHTTETDIPAYRRLDHRLQQSAFDAFDAAQELLRVYEMDKSYQHVIRDDKSITPVKAQSVTSRLSSVKVTQGHTTPCVGADRKRRNSVARMLNWRRADVIVVCRWLMRRRRRMKAGISQPIRDEQWARTCQQCIIKSVSLCVCPCGGHIDWISEKAC